MQIAPIRKSRVVPAPPATAFERFTREMALWWPLPTHSVFGEASAGVAMGGAVGEPLVESSTTGEESIWGRITIWDPPHRVAFTWHAGLAASEAQRVEVTFEAVAGGTQVTLEHSGWEVLGVRAAETRDGYEAGWDPVLARFIQSLDNGAESAS